MKVRAVICDVYGTLLEVGAAPSDAAVRWHTLFEEVLGEPPPFDRTEFSARASLVISQHHAEARSHGIPWPEVHWPSVVSELLPGLARLPARKFEDFLLRHMEIGRTIQLAEGAAECLRQIWEKQIALGIASNSQAYTIRELDGALQSHGLNLSIFDPDLRFWSFQNGFSKPDPHVFRILSTRLAAKNTRPCEILMVGDRLDNDIEPARARGWQTWHYTKGLPSSKSSGNWRDLLAWLA